MNRLVTPVHAELFTSSRGGEAIRARCYCERTEDHPADIGEETALIEMIDERLDELFGDEPIEIVCAPRRPARAEPSALAGRTADDARATASGTARSGTPTRTAVVSTDRARIAPPVRAAHASQLSHVNCEAYVDVNEDDDST